MIEVVGDTALIARMVTMGALADVAIKEASSLIARDVELKAKSLAPVETGRLRDSIQASEDGVSTDVDYAVFVEYGTADQAAQPFMRPAGDTANTDPGMRLAQSIIERA